MIMKTCAYIHCKHFIKKKKKKVQKNLFISPDFQTYLLNPKLRTSQLSLELR